MGSTLGGLIWDEFWEYEFRYGSMGKSGLERERNKPVFSSGPLLSVTYAEVSVEWVRFKKP